ncbi:MAG TPA: hypothetical protein VJL87_07715 [Bdellovibrionota bacterium]|nr:hypothetical protein [Bdellovibrionota bacterium]
MAKTKLTHIWEFSQEFSESIPILRELNVLAGTPRARAHQALRVAFLTLDEGKPEKRLKMIKDGALPPQSLSALNIS